MLKRILSILICTAIIVSASSTKKLTNSFTVEAGQKIEFSNFSGMKLQIKTWEKNEIKFDLDVRISSSDEDFEKSYLKTLDIVKNDFNGSAEIELVETKAERKNNFWGNFSFEKKIIGTVYIPVNNPVDCGFSYSTITIEKFSGEFSLTGKSNDLAMSECNNIAFIENDYGKLYIRNSGGNLKLENKSGKIEIEDFNGQLNLNADYATVELTKIMDNVIVEMRSGTLSIAGINGFLQADADYSTIKIYNVTGPVDVKTRSGSLTVDGAGALTVDAPYTNIDVKNVANQLSDQLKITSRSGTIKITGVNLHLLIDDSYSTMDLHDIKGNLNISSQSSAIIGNNIAGDILLRTSYSNIHFTRLTAGKVNISHQSNTVDLEFLNVPDEIMMKNQYGNIILTFPESFSAEYSLRTEYGDIFSDFNIDIEKDKRRNEKTADGVLGAGKCKMNIINKSAHIDIRRGR